MSFTRGTTKNTQHIGAVLNLAEIRTTYLTYLNAESCSCNNLMWPQAVYRSERLTYHHHYPVVCLMTVSKSLPKRSLHILRSTASSFKWQSPLLSLRSSSSFLRLLPRLLVTSISPFIFPSITYFGRHFLRKMCVFLQYWTPEMDECYTLNVYRNICSAYSTEGRMKTNRNYSIALKNVTHGFHLWLTF